MEYKELTLEIVLEMERLLFELEKEAGVYDREQPNYLL